MEELGRRSDPPEPEEPENTEPADAEAALAVFDAQKEAKEKRLGKTQGWKTPRVFLIGPQSQLKPGRLPWPCLV